MKRHITLAHHHFGMLFGLVVFALVTGGGAWWYGNGLQQQARRSVADAEQRVAEHRTSQEAAEASMSAALAALKELQEEDQYVKNASMQAELRSLKAAYTSAVGVYEDLLDLRNVTTKTSTQDGMFATLLVLLGKNDFVGANKQLASLKDSLSKELAKYVAVQPIPANTVESNAPPSSGYRRQQVSVDGVGFLVDIVTADLNSTRVIVDTASSSTCTQDCPVLALGDYVARNGAYAGINGSYFCPESYPSCADKKNSFDTLLMNKDKTYFNSDNNVYSTVPLAVFMHGSSRFLSASQDWGRDTGVDAVIANRPLLVLEGNNMFGGNDDAKESARSNRSFIGGSGNMAYMGVVRGATVAEAAKVLTTLGIRNAINLDSGGSTALWSGGYKYGPGRNIPNAVLFVQR